MSGHASDFRASLADRLERLAPSRMIGEKGTTFLYSEDISAIVAGLRRDSLGEADGAPRQQLVARIKRSSKYFGQTPPGEWFDVRVNRVYPRVSGNNNAYNNTDVVFGIRLDDGTVFELK